MNGSEFQEEATGKEVAASANAAEEAVDMSRDASNGPKKAFFVGILKRGDPESEPFASDPSMAISKPFVVSKAISAQDGSERDIPLDESIINRWPPFKSKEGDFVFGIEPARDRPFLFSSEHGTYPVQLISWGSFEESEGEPSARTYFNKHKQGELNARFPYVIGNEGSPGHVIVFDGTGAGQGLYLRGFLHFGGGKISFSDVGFFGGDFNKEVTHQNQDARFTYKEEGVFILIPYESMKGPHTVLECEGWKSLTAVSPEQAPAKTSDEKSLPSPLPPSVQDARDEKSARATEIFSSPPAPPTHNVPSFNCPDREEEFLRALIADIKKCGYDYNPQDIIRFHASVKTGSFTLLGGAPGCGKSSLAALYARALIGGTAPNQKANFLTVDVNPAWTEPSDILGYRNLKGDFVCATSGLVPFLRDSVASKQVRVVCMEEMNLARVEHYFANFIQALSRDESDRVLPGVPLGDGEPEKGDLSIAPNVRFVGTNNFDSTTQLFSARFYDRCNYIELQPIADEKAFPEELPSFARGNFSSGVGYEDYKGWTGSEVRLGQLKKKVVEKAEQVFKKLVPLHLTPSRRVRFGMLQYIFARPFFEGCGSKYASEDDCQMIAFDEAIAQRILPRYCVDYLKDESIAQRELQNELMEDMPLSYAFFNERCGITELRETPSRA